MKKMMALLVASTMILAVSACGSSATEESDVTEETMTVDVENQEITMLCEVNGTYFTEATRHGIVFADGSNGEKSVLRGLVDEEEFYQAMLDIGAVAGDNLTMDDMALDMADGVAVEGDTVEIYVTWDGQEEIPFADIIICSEGEYTMDMKFGGNLAYAQEYDTGCIVCLDSCAVGIISDATWVTGSTQTGGVEFFGNEEVLPEDGTVVTVIFRLAE